MFQKTTLPFGRVRREGAVRRPGVATLDYILLIGVVLPMLALVMWVAPRMIRLVYEFTGIVLGWPFT